MSEAQAGKLFNQALGVRCWLQALEAHHPKKTVAECAEVARAAIGYGVCSSTSNLKSVTLRYAKISCR
jgi:hypothetical protein